MKLSVVIPHLNQPDKLARCLKSVCSQTMPRSDYEVIVVDNGSVHMPQNECDQYNARLLLEPEPGPGPARNTGIAAAECGLIAFIDSDCLADANWLSSAFATFSNPNVQIVGGDVRIAYVDPDNLTALEAYESVFGYRQKLYIERMGFSATLNMAFRKSAFGKVGPFRGIAFAEDRDWGLRASQLGLRTDYLPDMKVFHPARTSMDQLRAKWNRHVMHDFAETRGSKVRLMTWYAKALAVALSPAIDFITIIKSNRLLTLKARWAATVALTQIRLYRSGRMLSMAVQSKNSAAPDWNIDKKQNKA
jgi:glycosyltransferase involved in cell wall biosynthesis